MLKLKTKDAGITFDAKVIVDHKMPKIDSDKWDKRKVNIGGNWLQVSSRNNGSYFVFDGTNFYISDGRFKDVKSVSIVKVEPKQKLDAKTPSKKKKEVEPTEAPTPKNALELVPTPSNLKIKQPEVVEPADTLGENLYNVISRAINTEGSYDPTQISYLYEESLTNEENEKVDGFLFWCYGEGKSFGRGNYEKVYQEYLSSK